MGKTRSPPGVRVSRAGLIRGASFSSREGSDSAARFKMRSVRRRVRKGSRPVIPAKFRGPHPF